MIKNKKSITDETKTVKRSRKNKVEEPVATAAAAVAEPVAVEPVAEPEPVVTAQTAPETETRRRGRPAQDRTVMMEAVIAALHDMFPDTVLFSRKQISCLGLPISYILHFVKVAATPVRGLYVIPTEWRNRWPGYNNALQDALKGIYKV